MRKQSLKGSVAIVTGAGRGIGRNISLLLTQHGVAVVLAGRNRRTLNSAVMRIRKAGGRAIGVPTDVSREADVVSLVKQTVKRFRRLDIVVNNAGIGRFGALADTTTEQWDEIMAVNARGPFLLCREAIPHLQKSRHPFIVNIGSVVSVKGYINQAAYSASKHALLGMSKALAKEVQKNGIRVHTICPGGVDTELVSRARPDIDRSELIHPDEIADIVLFLVTRRGNAVIDQIDVRRKSAAPWV